MTTERMSQACVSLGSPSPVRGRNPGGLEWFPSRSRSRMKKFVSLFSFFFVFGVFSRSESWLCDTLDLKARSWGHRRRNNVAKRRYGNMKAGRSSPGPHTLCLIIVFAQAPSALESCTFLVHYSLVYRVRHVVWLNTKTGQW